MALVVENLPVNARDVRDTSSILGGEGPLEEGMATHSTTVFLPGESHGQRSLESCHPWGRKDLDTTKANEHTQALRKHVELYIPSFNTTHICS